MAQQKSAKDKQASKNQSRTVTGPKRTAPTKAGGRSTSTMLTWGAIGLVVVIVAVLIIVKITGNGTSSKSGQGAQPAPASIVQAVTHIPQSVYDTVGVNSSATPVTPPTKLSGQPQLVLTSSNGSKLPGVFYFGAEYCPYCAAERWPMTAALSRFGSFSGLEITTSSATDVYPNTPTFSFAKASLSNPLFIFKAVERYSNIPDGSGSYTILQTPTQAEAALVNKYDSPTYIPGGSSGSIPFIDVANQFVGQGASYSPAILSGLTRAQIASGLSDATNPATQAIVATANYWTAAICNVTGGKPGNVCSSKGVMAAAKALKI